jgi:hypothetical protein
MLEEDLCEKRKKAKKAMNGAPLLLLEFHHGVVKLINF